MVLSLGSFERLFLRLDLDELVEGIEESYATWVTADNGLAYLLVGGGFGDDDCRIRGGVGGRSRGGDANGGSRFLI